MIEFKLREAVTREHFKLEDLEGQLTGKGCIIQS